jgi:hypothetical protein
VGVEVGMAAVKTRVGAKNTKLTIEVFTNHLELQIESNSVNASCIRFYERGWG